MISDVLGTQSLQPVILVGAGNLGSALLSYGGFRPGRLRDRRGLRCNELRPPPGERPGAEVRGMAELPGAFEIQERGVRMAILCVPAAARPGESPTASSPPGITGILNFRAASSSMAPRT
jgi:redox-sensing transcriptional repressor